MLAQRRACVLPAHMRYLFADSRDCRSACPITVLNLRLLRLAFREITESRLGNQTVMSCAIPQELKKNSLDDRRAHNSLNEALVLANELQPLFRRPNEN